AANLQVRLGRHRLHPAQEIGDVLFLGQYGAEPFELRLEDRHLAAELGQALRGGEPRFDRSLQLRDFRALGDELRLRRGGVEVPERAYASEPEDDEDAELRVPGQFAEVEFERHYR